MAASSAKTLVRGFLIGTISTAAITGVWAKWSGKKDVHVEYEEGVKRDPATIARAAEILQFGVPDQGPLIRHFSNHVLAYDQARKIPLWVAEHLTKDNLAGKANRKNSFFKPDPSLHEFFQADNSDYLRSGWSRGHMAPAGNNKHNQRAMDETFFLSNILPQDLDNNSGFWNRFEMYCRDLTKSYQDVFVVSGPLFLSHEEEDGKRYVKYQVIGNNEVAVPTHLYKLILTRDKNKSLQFSSFIVPNQPITSEENLSQYQVPLHQLEIKSGLKFFKQLKLNEAEDLCTSNGCKLVSGKELDLHFLQREISNAKSMDALDRVWEKIKKKNLQDEKVMKNAKNERIVQLNKREL